MKNITKRISNLLILAAVFSLIAPLSVASIAFSKSGDSGSSGNSNGMRKNNCGYKKDEQAPGN